jgi:hypothetical protein
MKSRKVAVVSVVVTSLIVSGLSYLMLSGSSETVNTKVSKSVELAADCIESAAGVLSSTEKPVETCLSTAAGQLTSVQETGLLLDELTGRASTDDRLRSRCNEIFREIGVTAWEIGGIETFTEGYGACGFGYYQGAMKEALKDDINGKNFIAMTSFCERFSVASSTPSLGEWYLCMEGIGRALASKNNKISDSEKICAKVSTADTSVVAACFSGAVKEQFSTGDIKVQAPEDAVNACKMSDMTLQAVCYKYALNYSGSSAAEITKFCVSLSDGPTQRGCWAGVGMRTGSTELFSSADSPGYTIGTKPAETAKVMNSVCGMNITDHCETSLMIELSMRVLDYNSVLSVCGLLADERRVGTCRGVAEQQQPVLLPAK